MALNRMNGHAAGGNSWSAPPRPSEAAVDVDFDQGHVAEESTSPPPPPPLPSDIEAMH